MSTYPCDNKPNKGDYRMVAYLGKTKSGYELTIVSKPCNGVEFNRGIKVAVAGRKEAKDICKKLGYMPYNF